MRRRDLGAVLFGAAMLARQHAAAADRRRVGLVDYGPREPGRLRLWKSFTDRMTELGYRPDTIDFDLRFANDSVERLAEIATDIVGTGVEILVSASTPATSALQRATSRIPIVIATGADPVSLGFANSFSRPGRNITGVATIDPETGAKRLELMRAMLPSARRFAVIFDDNNTSSRDDHQNVLEAARSLSVSVESRPIKSASELDAVFDELKASGIGPVLTAPSPLLFAARRQIAGLSLTHRLPTMSNERTYVDDGCLVSYGVNFAERFRKSAEYVDRILRGANPAELPIEKPTSFELVLNVTTADRLGLTVPDLLLARADDVVR